MPGPLDYLFGGQQPSGVDASVASTNGLPTWYQQYLSGIAGKATQIAGDQASIQVPAQSVAGFNADQTDAFQAVRDNQGSWKPNITAASQTAAGINGRASGLVDQAIGAVAGPSRDTSGQIVGYGTDAIDSVAGPAGTWDNTQAQKYMSPYTTQVIENIQRLGKRNLMENLLPQVQDQFLGSGQFGSTRNADILGRTVRDANTDINGQVSTALNSGYTNAQAAFAADANRQQQQQSLQANTELGAGNMVAGALSADATRQQQQQQMQGSAALQGAGAMTSAGTAGAQQLGALGTATQQLNLNDTQQLGAIGAQEQGLQQQGLDAAYTNATNTNNFDWNTLNNLNSVVRGLQLPSTVAQATNSPASAATPYSGSALSGVGALSTALGKA
jgi:hypothetical protein